MRTLSVILMYVCKICIIYWGDILPGYSELIKNFNKIRDFVRDFFIFGFRGRNDYANVSLRSYDNERRRIQSYLTEYISESWNGSNKTISISSDTAAKTTNPLFKVWQTKSFTRNDLFLHFVILDILKDRCLSAPEISQVITNEYITKLTTSFVVDVMTIRNKLKEYNAIGILEKVKKGKSVCFKLNNDCDMREELKDALMFYQNILPGGFLGTSQTRSLVSPFIYRQIFFAQTLDDTIILQVLDAISQKKSITVHQTSKVRYCVAKQIVPIKILSNTRTGRRYLVYYTQKRCRFATMRIDYIKSVIINDVVPNYNDIGNDYYKIFKNTFSTVHRLHDLKHVRLILYIDEKQEKYVLERLYREGQHGTVQKISENTFEYTIKVPDTLEMVPWLRTFIGRIVSIEGTEKKVISQFKRDIRSMMSQLDGEVNV